MALLQGSHRESFFVCVRLLVLIFYFIYLFIFFEISSFLFAVFGLLGHHGYVATLGVEK